MEMTKKIPILSLVDAYRKKVLHGITEINTRLHTLPSAAFVMYLDNVQKSLNFWLEEVKVHIEQLGSLDKAEDLAAMRVIEQDLMRIIIRVQSLHDKHHRLRTTTQIPIPSAPEDLEIHGTDEPLQPTAIEIQHTQVPSPLREKVEEKAKKLTSESVSQQPRKKLPGGPRVSIRQGTGKVKALREKMGLK
ncbi:14be723b-51bc-41b4-aec2-f9ab32674895 [Sclerotinia trifoliorum]|uniref:14be723b-51bc-41b4-aec2-f9ab32674895 n=1 Tax=Sclerotinia trifoliorum TaxID=28548 RepID=A0A8H2VP29_9HELO|nr:14be723b-51bc-41b4-aec2-f9ab32674895 [Sclerotinia trifoliorum]